LKKLNLKAKHKIKNKISWLFFNALNLMLSRLLTYISAITIKQAIKDVRWAVKTIKIGKIFMFYHLKPWKSWQVGLSSFI
jgi:L-asparagine transporter-like permease